MKREEVEALLHGIGLTAGEHKCQPADVAFEVEGDTLAALCRAWLALEDAPLGRYTGRAEVLTEIEHRMKPGTIPTGRVRIVPDGDEVGTPDFTVRLEGGAGK